MFSVTHLILSLAGHRTILFIDYTIVVGVGRLLSNRLGSKHSAKDAHGHILQAFKNFSKSP